MVPLHRRTSLVDQAPGEEDEVLNLLLRRLTLEAREAAASSDLGKRELTRALGTSASQLYRLLDPTNHSKSVGQMLALLHMLGRDVDVVVSPRRPTIRPKRSRRGKAAA